VCLYVFGCPVLFPSRVLLGYSDASSISDTLLTISVFISVSADAGSIPANLRCREPNLAYPHEQVLVCLSNREIVDASRGRTFYCKMANNRIITFFYNVGKIHVAMLPLSITTALVRRTPASTVSFFLGGGGYGLLIQFCLG